MSDDRGNLYIVAAPSGGGKTSLVKNLIASLDNIEVSVSHTTRAIRPGETHTVDYFFVKEDEFTDMIHNQAFVEYATVFNHLYGTSIGQISERLAKGIDVVLDIDWQGSRQIKRAFPDAISIFVIPPSLEALQTRLMNRQQDKDDIIAERMEKARDEMRHYSEFDYLIINDNFDDAALDLKAIVVTNRLSIQRQTKKQGKLLSFLLS